MRHRAFWLIFGLGITSCGSGEDGGEGKSPWFGTYTQHLCARQTVCCTAAGKGNDEASCRRVYDYIAGSDASKGHFDATLADECLTALDAARCDAETPEVCKRVITGNAPAGATCSSDFDCAAPEGGFADCVYDSSGARCIQHEPTQVGEPCDPTGSDDAVRPLCDAEHGFVCDTGGTCQKLPSEGDACSFDCEPGIVCGSASSGSVCAKPTPLGQACQPGECEETAYCSESGVCAVKKAWGEACSSTSGECDGACDTQLGKCQPFSYLCSE